MRVLVTGAGGVAGVNFVRAIKAGPERPYVVGTDFFSYHLHFPDLDKSYQSPRHSDPDFVGTIHKIGQEEKIDFIHPQPESEAYVISSRRKEVGCKVFLPPKDDYEVGRDKLSTAQAMQKNDVPAPRTESIHSENDVGRAYNNLGVKPVWVRARTGAGGKRSLLCDKTSEIESWIRVWVEKRAADWSDFILQEYLPGRDIAWDSLWFKGKLVTSYTRERLEYVFPNVAPSGVTGTPAVSRIILDEEVNRTGRESVLAITREPHGFFSVDMKENREGTPCITEVNVGKFHTTAPLWSYAAVKRLAMPWFANVAFLYLMLGIHEKIPNQRIPEYNLLPENIYLLRHIDCGAILWRPDGWKVRLL